MSVPVASACLWMDCNYLVSLYQLQQLFSTDPVRGKSFDEPERSGKWLWPGLENYPNIHLEEEKKFQATLHTTH